MEMPRFLADEAKSTTAARSGVVLTLVTWQGNRQWSYPDTDFVWVQRWTRIGPSGGNNDTVLGTVSFEKLAQLLTSTPGKAYSFQQLQELGVATPGSR